MSYCSVHQILLLSAVLSVISGCKSVRAPSGEQWRQAATNAISDPQTWVPIASAAVIKAGKLENDVASLQSTTNQVSLSNTAVMQPEFTTSSRYISRISSYPGPEDNAELKLTWVFMQNLLMLADPYNNWSLESNRQGFQGNEFDYFSMSFNASEFYGVIGQTTDGAGGGLPVRPVSSGGSSGSMFRPQLVGLRLSTPDRREQLRLDEERPHPAEVLLGAALGNFLNVFFHDALSGDDNVSMRLKPSLKKLSFEIKVRF